jgi:hypothetical protein
MLPKGAGWLPGEPQPAPVKPYPGAYYTARRSSRWHWYGEEFQVTLGTPHLDPTRKVWRKDLVEPHLVAAAKAGQKSMRA